MFSPNLFKLLHLQSTKTYIKTLKREHKNSKKNNRKNRNTGYPAHEPPRSENIKNIKKEKQKNFEKNTKTEIQAIQPTNLREQIFMFFCFSRSFSVSL